MEKHRPIVVEEFDGGMEPADWRVRCSCGWTQIEYDSFARACGGLANHCSASNNSQIRAVANNLIGLYGPGSDNPLSDSAAWSDLAEYITDKGFEL